MQVWSCRATLRVFWWLPRVFGYILAQIRSHRSRVLRRSGGLTRQIDLSGTLKNYIDVPLKDWLRHIGNVVILFLADQCQRFARYAINRTRNLPLFLTMIT